jgi:HAD superfamily hydrolase (TIGR01509 family)
MLSGVILDLDGVLIDSHPIHKAAWRKFLFSVGKDVSDAELEFVTSGAKRLEILRHFLGELSSEQVERYGQQKDLVFFKEQNALETIKGVDLFLSALEEAHIPKAVATNASRSRTKRILDRLRLTRRFHPIVTGDDVSNGKPDPTVFLEVARKMQVYPENLLVIEDSVLGVRAARAAGMKCLGIARADQAAKLRGAGVDLVVTDYTCLKLSDLQRLFGN